MYVYDTRARAALGQKQKLSVTVQPYEPVILAVSPMPLPALHLFAPDEAARGSVVHIGLQCPRTPASVQVLHVEVATPDGKRALQYTGNVLARDGRAVKSFPLAVNDPSGEWTIRVHDLMSGQTVTQLLKVK
jgi:hypothetical protein